MTGELLTLIALHFMCNAEAESRILTAPEARLCDDNFTKVKLAFAGGPEIADYRTLPLGDQVRLNRVGYARYRDWLAANPVTVREFESLRCPSCRPWR